VEVTGPEFAEGSGDDRRAVERAVLKRPKHVIGIGAERAAQREPDSGADRNERNALHCASHDAATVSAARRAWRERISRAVERLTGRLAHRGAAWHSVC